MIDNQILKYLGKPGNLLGMKLVEKLAIGKIEQCNPYDFI